VYSLQQQRHEEQQEAHDRREHVSVPYELIAFVNKSQCHLQLGDDLAAALLSINSCSESLALQEAEKVHNTNLLRIDAQYVQPLRQELFQRYLTKVIVPLVTSPSDFPVFRKVSGVRFEFSYESGRAGCIQSLPHNRRLQGRDNHAW